MYREICISAQYEHAFAPRYNSVFLRSLSIHRHVLLTGVLFRKHFFPGLLGRKMAAAVPSLLNTTPVSFVHS